MQWGKNTYFLSTHYKFIQNDKIEEGTLLTLTNANSDPFDYPLGERGVDFFETLEHSHVHSFYPHKEDEEKEDDDLVEENEENEDLIEANYCNKNTEVDKFFKSKVCFML